MGSGSRWTSGRRLAGFAPDVIASARFIRRTIPAQVRVLADRPCAGTWLYVADGCPDRETRRPSARLTAAHQPTPSASRPPVTAPPAVRAFADRTARRRIPGVLHRP